LVIVTVNVDEPVAALASVTLTVKDTVPELFGAVPVMTPALLTEIQAG
jgi:hypothetical protein